MRAFTKQQLEKIKNYISDEFLVTITPITAFLPTEDKNCEVSEVLYKERKYKLYRHYDELILVPKELTSFENDFDDIIIYGESSIGFCISFYRKKDSIIESNMYNISTSFMGTEGIYGDYLQERCIEAENNLQKKYIESQNSLIKFLIRNNHILAIHSDNNSASNGITTKNLRIRYDYNIPRHLPEITKEILDSFFKNKKSDVKKKIYF